SEEVRKMTEKMDIILKGFSEVLSFHDLRIVGRGQRENLVFDVVVKKGVTLKEEKILRQAITEKVQQQHPFCNCVITFDQNDMLINEY
ncbi:MAG TPA: cation transporter, partial [Syntrophomonadaceae bacterium]|nr:cation transporter [Syntrophomonadaceae bacterium]